MQNNWFQFRVNRTVILVFWSIVLAIFLGIYLFAPSIFNQMRQVSYQNTPFVDTPMRP